MASIVSSGLILFLLLSNPTSSQVVKCKGNCVCPSGAAFIGQECTLQCTGSDSCKDKKLVCREGDVCNIKCVGDSVCSGNTVVDGSKASDVNVLCSGSDSCKGNTKILCGTGDCKT